MPRLDHAAIHTIIAGITLAMFLSALEQTIVAPALPAIGKSLGDFDNLPWVVTAYLLAATAATPLFGKLTDIHGRRTIMLLAIGIFIVGSLVCALAPTMWLLIVGRGLQGIGGGGLDSDCADHHRRSLKPARAADGAELHVGGVHERQQFSARCSAGFSPIICIGRSSSGSICPLGAVALVMTGRALRRLPRHDRPHELDIPGVTLMVGRRGGAAVGARLGRHAVSLAVLADRPASSRPRRCCGRCYAARLLTAREPFIPLAILRGKVTSAITCAALFLDRHDCRRDDLCAALLPARAAVPRPASRGLR